jgi:hypothetical protein
MAMFCSVTKEVLFNQVQKKSIQGKGKDVLVGSNVGRYSWQTEVTTNKQEVDDTIVHVSLC